MSIIVVGTVALDSISSPEGSREYILGGSAFHFAHSASLLTKVNVVSVIGADYPDEGKLFMTKRGVDIAGVELISGDKTFFWEGKYEDDFNTAVTIDTQLNVLAKFEPKIPESYQNSDYLFLANIDPDLQLSVMDQANYKKACILDTMNFWINSKPESLNKAIARSDIVILNNQEIQDITGRKNLLKAGEEILKKGVSYIIIKKGEFGAALFSRDGYFNLTSYPVKKVVDPTGAGDSFAGALISYLDHKGNWDFPDLVEGLSYATIISSFYVEGFGPDGLANITKQDINKRFEEFKRFTRIPDRLVID